MFWQPGISKKKSRTEIIAMSGVVFDWVSGSGIVFDWVFGSGIGFNWVFGSGAGIRFNGFSGSGAGIECLRVFSFRFACGGWRAGKYFGSVFGIGFIFLNHLGNHAHKLSGVPSEYWNHPTN